MNDECGYCRYSMRSFAINSSSLDSHYPEGCVCDRPRITLEQYKINSKIESDKREKTILQQNVIFTNNWKISSPSEKLNLYGVVKLKMLAKSKGLKNYSKYTKLQMIATLTQLVDNNDFPIK